jgi:hypothetical protein
VGDDPTPTSAPLDLEADPSTCIGLLPKPGCGREPVDAGDRGGPLQVATFAVMLLGLAIIGARIALATRRRSMGRTTS